MSAVFKLLKILWALPYTCIGLTIGLAGLITGGKFVRSAGAFEFHGGAVTWLLGLIPIRPSAMTLGHTIIGLTLDDLDRTRDHEMVHVRQFERWGILFGPAYLIASFIAFRQGKDYYRDNVFEVEAYSTTEVRPRSEPANDDEN